LREEMEEENKRQERYENGEFISDSTDDDMEGDDSEEDADGGESEEDEGEHEDDKGESEGEEEEEEEEEEHEELRAILDKYKLEWLAYQTNGSITMAQRDKAFSEITQACERAMLRKREEIMEEEEDESEEGDEEHEEEEENEKGKQEEVRATKSKPNLKCWVSDLLGEETVARSDAAWFRLMKERAIEIQRKKDNNDESTDDDEDEEEHEKIRALRKKQDQEWWDLAMIDELTAYQKINECVRMVVEGADEVQKKREEIAKRGE
jgi:hypothetical protein